jgi:hypothetical protein
MQPLLNEAHCLNYFSAITRGIRILGNVHDARIVACYQSAVEDRKLL